MLENVFTIQVANAVGGRGHNHGAVVGLGRINETTVSVAYHPARTACEFACIGTYVKPIDYVISEHGPRCFGAYQHCPITFLSRTQRMTKVQNAT